MSFLKYILIAMSFLSPSLSFGEPPAKANFKEFFGTYKIVSCEEHGDEGPNYYCGSYATAVIGFPDRFWKKNVFIEKFGGSSSSFLTEVLANDKCTLNVGVAECDRTDTSAPRHYSIKIEKISKNSIRLKMDVTSYMWSGFTKIPTGTFQELILEKQSDKVCTRYGTATSCE